MSNAHRRYEVRCPVHGFIALNDWEWNIINQPAFQRLRRIRQLAWTDQVYPGAMHTRFEHSLGVMELVGRLYDAVVQRSSDVLRSPPLHYDDFGFQRDRIIVRLAALLHDTGHSPFSHGAEELFPPDPAGRPYRHEAYSAAVVRTVLREAIEKHPLNGNYRITADEVAYLLEGLAEAGRTIVWRELIDGQMDGDRMDYLLRDSLHTGVDYGKYDWHRILNTITAVEETDPESPTAEFGVRMGVSEGGIHAAEALVLARYYMFTQVYFHKTRVAYDHHIRHAMRDLLPDGRFPPPTADRVAEYLGWDDWRVLGRLADGQGGEHGDRLRTRDHYRQVYRTPENTGSDDRQELARVRDRLGDLVAATESSNTTAYKLQVRDIPVLSAEVGGPVRPLSHYSSVVRNLHSNAIDMTRLYARPEHAQRAREIVAQTRGANP